jgi:hypothetical protein
MITYPPPIVYHKSTKNVIIITGPIRTEKFYFEPIKKA